MIESIIAAILGFLKAIPIFAKYFPPKTVEEKVEEGKTAIDGQIKSITDDGRP